MTRLCQATVDEAFSRYRALEPERRKQVLVVLERNLEESVDAKYALVDLHAKFVEQNARTAYVAEQPRYRGMALYALRYTECDAGRAFGAKQLAEEWLNTNHNRMQTVLDETMSHLADCQERMARVRREQAQ